LAALSGSELADGANPDLQIKDVAPLDVAGEGDISFFENRKYTESFRTTSASACIARREDASKAPSGVALLLSSHPYKSYALVAQHFYPRPEPEPYVAPSAVVSSSAAVGEGCYLAPGVVIEEGAEVGDQVHIGPNSVIAEGVKIGDRSWIGANVSISHALIGDRVTIHQGACIGQDGFGIAPDPAGHVKVPQLGRVIIGDDCEIGANTAIDRGAGPDTVLEAHCWVDNLVQIAHNVHLGRGCIITGQVGFAGSTHLEEFVFVGGQAGFAGHLRVGAGTHVGGQAGVTSDVPPGSKITGTPARPLPQHFRIQATLNRMVARKGKRDE
jgi:UDP-3-O-[3-hydroxymyristoyl] glucosamine N-acyltransferase